MSTIRTAAILQFPRPPYTVEEQPNAPLLAALDPDLAHRDPSVAFARRKLTLHAASQAASRVEQVQQQLINQTGSAAMTPYPEPKLPADAGLPETPAQTDARAVQPDTADESLPFDEPPSGEDAWA